MKSNNQGKTPQQIKDSNKFVAIGYIVVVIVISGTLIGIGEYTGFNKEVQQGLKDDPRPKSHLWNYLPPSFYDTLELPTPIDSSLLECGDSTYYMGTNQVGRTHEEQLSIEPDYMYYDTVKLNKK